MKTLGTLHPTNDTPIFPDNVGVAVISSAGAVVAQDWPSGAQLVGFDAPAAFWIHPRSTGVAVGTTSQAGSTSQNLSIRMNNGHERIFQIAAESTGYSITAETSGVIGLSFWRK